MFFALLAFGGAPLISYIYTVKLILGYGGDFTSTSDGLYPLVEFFKLWWSFVVKFKFWLATIMVDNKGFLLLLLRSKKKKLLLAVFSLIGSTSVARATSESS